VTICAGGRNRVPLKVGERPSCVGPAPPDANVRTTVHEYGGGSWWVDNGDVFYVDYADQRVRCIPANGEPLLLTPVPETDRGLRYADFRRTPDGKWLLAVCERHDKGQKEPSNSLVAIATDGSLKVVILVEGCDFYGSPRISPNTEGEGDRICWVQWNHPNMPWDDTELWQAELVAGDGAAPVISGQRRVAGGKGIAIVQPEFDPTGQLHYLSDVNDLWHLYREASDEPVLTVDGEIGYPPWVFGLSRYCFKENGQPVAARFVRGLEALDGADQYSAFHSLRACGDSVAYVGCSWFREAAVHYEQQEIVQPRDLGIDPAYLVEPEVIEFPTTDNDKSYALYFRPANPDCEPLDDEKPPLLVLAHGGPTAAARAHLSLARQFWTSRGFAVVDVNYRGSCGFGRAYREKLKGEWGVADVADCVNAAKFLAERGDVDPQRLLIRGGSAGGYTVLCALAFHEVFSAGCSLYGVADLEALATDTHKFESRYLDNLVGPYPQDKHIYQARSPINHLEGFNAPMIVLQGSEDAIVPPNQSRMIVDALDKRKVPVAYIEFEGEQHGFRKAENIKRALHAELEFYLRVFAIMPDDVESDLEIKHLAGFKAAP